MVFVITDIKRRPEDDEEMNQITYVKSWITIEFENDAKNVKGDIIVPATLV